MAKTVQLLSDVGLRDGLAPGLSCALPYACRYSVAETVQLLSEVGLRDGSPFESNGITGGDLLDLEEEELKEDLHLSNLQVCCVCICNHGVCASGLECCVNAYRCFDLCCCSCLTLPDLCDCLLPLLLHPPLFLFLPLKWFRSYLYWL